MTKDRALSHGFLWLSVFAFFLLLPVVVHYDWSFAIAFVALLRLSYIAGLLSAVR